MNKIVRLHCTVYYHSRGRALCPCSFIVQYQQTIYCLCQWRWIPPSSKIRLCIIYSRGSCCAWVNNCIINNCTWIKSIILKDSGHYWLLSKTSLLTWCISTYIFVMHKPTNMWKFELDWSSELRDNNERKKTPLSHKVVCFQMLDFETSNSKLGVSKSNSWKITSFPKTSSLQREPFLTMFYTINLSPLIINKRGFLIILSNITNSVHCI